MQFLYFASRSNTIMIHSHHHQVQRRNSRKQCLAYPPWLSDLQMVNIEIWLENKLPGLPKNTGVVIHCPRVLWKALARPNHYNITAIYVNTYFQCRSANVTGACYRSHRASQVAAFGCSLSYVFNISWSLIESYSVTELSICISVFGLAPQSQSIHTSANPSSMYITLVTKHSLGILTWVTSQTMGKPNFNSPSKATKEAWKKMKVARCSKHSISHNISCTPSWGNFYNETWHFVTTWQALWSPTLSREEGSVKLKSEGCQPTSSPIFPSQFLNIGSVATVTNRAHMPFTIISPCVIVVTPSETATLWSWSWGLVLCTVTMDSTSQTKIIALLRALIRIFFLHKHRWELPGACDIWDITAYLLLPESKYYYEK